MKISVDFKETTHKTQKHLLEQEFQNNLIITKTDAEFYEPDTRSDIQYDSDVIDEIEETSEEIVLIKPVKRTPKPKPKSKSKPKNENLSTRPQCELCGKICINLARLRDHKLLAHGGEKSEICEICNKGFVLKFQLKRHMDIHLNKRQWKCNFGNCDRGFNDRTGLRSHSFICPERTVIEKPHECQICHKTFPFPARLTDHMKMYHLGTKKFACEECDKIFSRPFKLREHMRVHTGEKPYKCYYCDKSFRCQKHLKPHHNVHHKGLEYIGEGRKVEDMKTELIIN